MGLGHERLEVDAALGGEGNLGEVERFAVGDLIALARLDAQHARQVCRVIAGDFRFAAGDAVYEKSAARHTKSYLLFTVVAVSTSRTPISPFASLRPIVRSEVFTSRPDASVDVVVVWATFS